MPWHQAPRESEEAQPGQGTPSSLRAEAGWQMSSGGISKPGKSTLNLSYFRGNVLKLPISVYDLEPGLGVRFRGRRTGKIHGPFIVVANLPGLIEGAHTGVGLASVFCAHRAHAPGGAFD